MKAIIFDVDNTLITWNSNYILSVNKALDMLNIKYDKSLPLKIYNAVDANEREKNILDKEDLIEYINNYCQLSLPLKFVDNYIITYGECIINDDKLLKMTLKYLSNKYDLFVISNWFTESQRMRLQKMGILKYFKKIYGGDINYLKPDPRTFDVILKDYPKEDCVYVGDKLKTDIEFAESLGIKSIWKTNENSEKYQTIKKISDLMNIF